MFSNLWAATWAGKLDVQHLAASLGIPPSKMQRLHFGAPQLQHDRPAVTHQPHRLLLGQTEVEVCREEPAGTPFGSARSTYAKTSRVYSGSTLTNGRGNSLRDVAGEPLPTACNSSWYDGGVPATSGSSSCSIALHIRETKSGSLGLANCEGSMGRLGWPSVQRVAGGGGGVCVRVVRLLSKVGEEGFREGLQVVPWPESFLVSLNMCLGSAPFDGVFNVPSLNISVPICSPSPD